MTTTRKGFTLTEVLITLGIIGILAALTIPRLFNNTRNAHVGAQFASAISAIETGAGMYLYDKGVKNTTFLSGTDDAVGTPSAFLDKLDGQYVKMTKTKPSGMGTLGNNVKCAEGTIYSLPDKSLVCVNTDGTLTSKKSNSWAPADAELVFISSKSIHQKNLIEGYDFFRMSISAEGLIFLPGLDYGDTTCESDTGGIGCAGKVAQNGWKVTY